MSLQSVQPFYVHKQRGMAVSPQPVVLHQLDVPGRPANRRRNVCTSVRRVRYLYRVRVPGTRACFPIPRTAVLQL